jgi:hypothetical protein
VRNIFAVGLSDVPVCVFGCVSFHWMRAGV